MKRNVYSQLLNWKNSPGRKPLVVFGSRQVGKTYILKEFGNKEFDNLVYINCYKNSEIERLFADDKDIGRILLGLSVLSRQEIKKNKTLIFLDEVQDVPDVVASLKYFCEDAPGIAVAVAGSLLGVKNMERISFPTGKVNIIRMYPMTFDEFIDALGEGKMKSLLNDLDQPGLINTLLPKYTELLRQYYFVGGMPEAVAEFVKNRFPESVRKIQEDILAGYDADIAKHAGRDTQKARLVFQSIPNQLAKENKKFTYEALKKGARGAAYENAIQWLVDAGLVYKVPRLSTVELPIKSYMDLDSFKLFLLDTGLLGAMAMTEAKSMLIGNKMFSEYKGAFTENYVMTQIVSIPGTVIGYYSKKNSSMEIDFVVQVGGQLLPVEVKAEENVKAKSLRTLINVDKRGSGLHGVRFSMKGYIRQDWMTNVPLFAARAFIENLVSADAAAAPGAGAPGADRL